MLPRDVACQPVWRVVPSFAICDSESPSRSRALVASGSSTGSGRLDAVAFEVVELERSQEFGDLIAT
jgi:hypothetical protein